MAWGTLVAALSMAGVGCGDDGSAGLASTTEGSGDGSGTTSAADGGTAEETAVADSTTTGDAAAGWELSLEVGAEVGAFYSVWGPTPALVYAVAGQPLEGGLSAGAIYRWDGEAWAEHAAPDNLPALHWVYGIDSMRFVVGDFGVLLTREGDQGEWTRHTCDTILPWWGVWGAAPDDVWAVGGDGFNRDPIACHWDGADWTRLELPEPSIESHALYKVWGTATDNVWAVGDEGLIMHYTGEAEGWVEVPSGTDFDLISLWGTGPQEILAVGGRASGMLCRFDGAQWVPEEAPALFGLNGIWMDPDGAATTVGPMGGAGRVEAGALDVELLDSGTPLALHAIYGWPGQERWAVGGSLDMAPPHVGVIVRVP